MLAHGLVSDRSGKVVRRFVVTMHCNWVGDAGTLDEQFVYDDGERQHRLSGASKGCRAALRRHRGRRCRRRAGCGRGRRLQLALHAQAAGRGTVYDVQFDDWMHLIDERVVLNKAVMSKFGVRVGEITLSFTRP